MKSGHSWRSGYGPRCVPVMQLTEAAAKICDLLWLIDGSIPEMQQMTDLLNRFGPVVDISGLDAEPDPRGVGAPVQAGRDRHLSRRQHDHVRPGGRGIAASHFTRSRQLPPSPTSTSSAGVGRAAGLPVPPCEIVTAGAVRAGSGRDRVRRWAGPPFSSPARPRGAATPSAVNDAAQLDHLLDSLGPTRPDMVLEGYLADDPARAEGPYAAYVSVESIAAAGVVSHLALTGRFPMAENFRETGFFIPAALEDADQKAALELATSAIEALGVHTGCLHTEIKFTPDGPRVIEVNGRVGGGVPEMLGACRGRPTARVDPAGVARARRFGSMVRWPPNASGTGSSCSHRRCRPRWRRSRGWTP